MESKHFSHQHPLFFHQVPQGSHAHCSGCKSPASGNVFACWQCRYFLHDQCFRATRSLNHPSHPFHPLSLVPFPTYPSASFFCNSCSLAGDGFSYSCSACEFDLHLHCALTLTPHHNPHNCPQNPVLCPPPIPIHTYPLPQPQHYQQPQINYAPPPPSPLHLQQPNATAPPPPQPSVHESKEASMLKHFSHPHALKQTEMEKTKAKVVMCSACERQLSGSAYSCTESYCTFNLHKACFDSPRVVKHMSHLLHPLTLLAAPPYSGGFNCNACQKNGKALVYNCGACSYDLHIDCIRWPDTMTRPDHNHNLTLYYSSPTVNGALFICDACKNPVHKMAWLYYCRDCDFGTHLECVTSEIREEEEQKFSELELRIKAETQQAILELWD